jgi:YD repeat-containing protein
MKKRKTLNLNIMKRKNYLFLSKFVRLSLLCIGFVTTVNAYAQGLEPNKEPEPKITPPDAWGFMTYGGNQPNLYTGTVRADIPIYTYEDSDFTIPVTVSYASNGFIPNMPSGSLGLGWFLNTGGCITREVIGFPDEQRENMDTGNPPPSGYYWYYQVANKSNTPILQKLRNSSLYQMDKPIIIENGEWFDAQSDKYSFNFMGHSGKFILGPDKVHVFNSSGPQGEYRVDMSEFANESDNSSVITITTGDGYVYTFDSFNNGGYGSPKNVVMRRTTLVGRRPSDPSNPTASNCLVKTWLLREIKAPNGRVVKFEYSEPKFGESVIFSGEGIISPADGKLSLNHIKIASRQLTKITVGHDYLNAEIFEMDFIYRERDKMEKCKYYYGGHIETSIKGLDQLESICVYSRLGNKRLIKECDFTYKYPNNPNSNNILMLKNIDISGEGIYSMNYFDEDQIFPFQGSTEFDHWGYFNEWHLDYYPSATETWLGIDLGDDPYYTINALTYSFIHTEDYSEFGTSARRSPNRSASLRGMLSRLTYPTGGFTAYGYEAHDYSKQICRDLLSQNKPELRYASDQLAGGTRIRMIVDCARNGVVRHSREFIYDENGVSSGNLLHMPRYHLDVEQSSINREGWVNIFRIPELSACSGDTYHMEYRNVYEKFGDGSYVLHKFSNYTTIPDIFDISAKINYHYSGNVITTTKPDYFDNFLADLTSLSAQRGKTTSKEYYNADNVLQKKEEWHYDTNKTLESVESIRTTVLPWDIYEYTGSIYYAYKTLVEDYPLISHTETQYLNEVPLVNKHEFEYNSGAQLTSKKTTHSDGKVYYHDYQYPLDQILSERNNVTKAMIERNMVSYPLREQKSVREGQQKKLLEGTLYDYNHVGSSASVITLNQAKTTEFTQPMAIPDFGFDSHLKSATQYTCDYMGNIVQITDRNGIPITYIWGYDGVHVVAVVKNATLADVQNADTGFSHLDYQPLQGALSATEASALRNIPGAMVTSYSYLPYIGIIAQVDPSGRKTTYEYYPDGKLKTIKDDKGNQVKSYEYHIKTN